MKIGWSVTIFLSLLVMHLPATAQSKAVPAAEQSQFSAEDEAVNKPVAIPADVLALLAKDEGVSNELGNENLPAKKLPQAWFSASAIHLGGQGKPDLIVVGKGPLVGANVTTFWVFRATVQGFERVLTAPAHDLVVRNTHWNHLREIELDSMTAVQFHTAICRFNGRKYVLYRDRWEPIQ